MRTDFVIETGHRVAASSPQQAVRYFLRDLLNPGVPIVFQVRECGGMGGGVTTVIISNIKDDLDVGDDSR